MIFTKNYQLLVQEGHLSKSCLLRGLDAIRSANIDDKRRGLFYSGLFDLAAGFERLMKIVFILDYKINNNLQNPSNKKLKGFSHDLKGLFSKCCELPNVYQLPLELNFSNKQMAIISTLSEFAKGSRYYNFDVLTNDNKNEDPISRWLSVIDDHILELRKDVNLKLQNDAIKMAVNLEELGEWKQGIDGEFVTSIDFYYLMLATEKANPHVIKSIIEILYPFYWLIKHQCNELANLFSVQNKESEIPCMFEFFSFFLTPKSSILRKKRWA